MILNSNKEAAVYLIATSIVARVHANGAAKRMTKRVNTERVLAQHTKWYVFLTRHSVSQSNNIYLQFC